jgi:hypothetical protein
MMAATISVLLVMVAGVPQAQAQSSKAESGRQDRRQKREADKAAAKILTDTGDLQVVPTWYEQVYPALKRRYKGTVTHALYDAWRARYFQNELAPLALKYGYGLELARQEFMKQTEQEPSN